MNGTILSGSRMEVSQVLQEYEAIPEKTQVGHVEYINEIDYEGHKINMLKYWEETIKNEQVTTKRFQWMTSITII